MFKTIKVKLILLAVFALFIGACSTKKKEQTETTKTDTKKVIYTTFFPVAELTKLIVGDKMEVETIIKAGQEPHSFELQINDRKAISNADLIIFNGANMEEFIHDLEEALQDEDKFLDLSQGLTLLSSEDDHEEHDHDHDHGGINPHTWLSVKNAMIQLDTIYQKISSIDPENDVYYKENLDQALVQFKALDEKFESELAKVTKDKYFVVSHAAFNYLANDYGLTQVAVTGISPEEEPSAKQLKEIADFVKEHEITTIFFEGKATPKVAETLATNTGTKTATLYTLESLTEQEQALGYIKLMEMNLEALVGSFHD